MSDVTKTNNFRSPEDDSFSTISFDSSTEGLGSQIGPYKLLGILGEGAFGIVYLAEQKKPVRRRVALKIIKPGMDSKQVIARFEAERQALALLDHPNIAYVYDAGTTKSGRPYFAMEYIKGESITKHCDRRRLNIEDRLELFLHVCGAIQHAHQKGIIHRDIKPSNILVAIGGEKAIPKIIDFGVAKAITQPLTERTLFTAQGQLVGTPEYMSPEQVEMANEDIDTRSDIYSLGVLLYVLLTGALPFDRRSLQKAAFSEILRIIREEDPPHPSTRLSSLGEEAKQVADSRRTEIATLAKRLRKELEWIPLKAMQKDREERYRSASQLADDVRNYLNAVPLIAGPPSTLYRVKKYLLKYRAASIVVVLLLVILCSTSVISFSFYSKASRALEELGLQRYSVKRIADKDAIRTDIDKPEVLYFFLDLWFGFDEDSPEGMAANTYFFDLRSEFHENSLPGIAARFVLDPRPLAEKESEFRRKLSADQISFLEFLIGEYHFNSKRSRAIEAYKRCLEASKDRSESDAWYKTRAKRKLDELLNKNTRSNPKMGGSE